MPKRIGIQKNFSICWINYLAKCASNSAKVVCPIVCVTVTFSFLAIGACSSADRTEWREEIELASGATTIVKRTAHRDKSGFPVSRRGPWRELTIVFPNGVEWKSDGLMLPIASELNESNVFVVAKIGSREYCKEYGDPPSSVLYFRWSGDRWTRVPKEEYPHNGKANLLLNPWGSNSSGDANGFIKSKDKFLAMPNNDHVNEPLEKVLQSNWIDSCQMLKQN